MSVPKIAPPKPPTTAPQKERQQKRKLIPLFFHDGFALDLYSSLFISAGGNTLRSY